MGLFDTAHAFSVGLRFSKWQKDFQPYIKKSLGIFNQTVIVSFGTVATTDSGETAFLMKDSDIKELEAGVEALGLNGFSARSTLGYWVVDNRTLCPIVVSAFGSSYKAVIFVNVLFIDNRGIPTAEERPHFLNWTELVTPDGGLVGSFGVVSDTNHEGYPFTPAFVPGHSIVPWRNYDSDFSRTGLYAISTSWKERKVFIPEFEGGFLNLKGPTAEFGGWALRPKG